MQCNFDVVVTLSFEQLRGAMASALTDQDALRIATHAVQLYAETHPRPVQFNQKQAAEMLGISARTVHNLLKPGTLRLNRCALIPIAQIDAAIIASVEQTERQEHP